MKIQLNQEVILVPIGNNRRYSTENVKATVSKIGRKWFKVETSINTYIGRDNQFSLNDGRCDGKGYSPEWQVYESEEVYKELQEIPKLRKNIINSLDLPYKQLLEVYSFIKSFSAENN